MAELERIAYDNALRALDKQERVLEELRARTGVLVAASSLATSLLGSVADGRSPVLLLVALLAFTASLGASLFVLLPRRGFVFAAKGRTVYERFYDQRHDVAEIHRRLAYILTVYWDRNDRLLRPAQRATRLCATGLVVQVAASAVATAGMV